MWHSRPPRDPPFITKAILNFHFDYFTPSLIELSWTAKKGTKITKIWDKTAIMGQTFPFSLQKSALA